MILQHLRTLPEQHIVVRHLLKKQVWQAQLPRPRLCDSHLLLGRCPMSREDIYPICQMVLDILTYNMLCCYTFAIHLIFQHPSKSPEKHSVVRQLLMKQVRQAQQLRPTLCDSHWAKSIHSWALILQNCLSSPLKMPSRSLRHLSHQSRPRRHPRRTNCQEMNFPP